MAFSKTQTYTLSEGIELSFTDGGPPPNSADYTTLFVVHGVAFNAYQFKKVHEHAHAFNFRVVALHRRDYIGSTPYSLTELKEIGQGDRAFWDRISAQLAELLKTFIERENIPKPSVSGDQRSGGITIMGWSFGCATALSLLGSPENSRISDEIHDFLSEYIDNFILYDAPFQALGYPVSPDCPNYLPWLDSSLAPAELPAAFAKWVGSYYDHCCYDPTTRSLSTSASVLDLDGVRPYTDKEEEISTTFWTEEELTKGIEGKSGEKDILFFSPAPQANLNATTNRALFDTKSARSWFPNVKVAYIGGTRTLWVCAWAEIETKRRYYSCANGGSQGLKSNGVNGYKARSIRFFEMDGANHFAHWDRTTGFLQLVKDAIRR